MAPFVSISAVAEQFGISERTVRRYIAAGALPAYRLAQRQIRIKAADVERLLTPIPTAGGGPHAA